jgi:hypothetical protein
MTYTSQPDDALDWVRQFSLGAIGVSHTTMPIFSLFLLDGTLKRIRYIKYGRAVITDPTIRQKKNRGRPDQPIHAPTMDLLATFGGILNSILPDIQSIHVDPSISKYYQLGLLVGILFVTTLAWFPGKLGRGKTSNYLTDTCSYDSHRHVPVLI